MLDKPLEQIEIADLQELITDKVQEGKTIDYKQAMYRLDSPNPEDKDKQREELLKDVSSFANTIGGHLIIGMAEDKGIPTAIPGVTVLLDDPDKEKNRLSQLIEQWLEPRISCGMHAIEVQPKQYVLVIRVPQSLVSPHRVVYQKQFGQFWARNSTGAYRMDTSELRRAFTLSESIYEQIKQFRRERIRLIMDGETPVPIEAASSLILHLIPLDSFATRLTFDVQVLERVSRHFGPPAGTTGWGQRINMDGIVTFRGGGSSAVALQHGYTQAFRNGIVEATVSSIAVRSKNALVGCLDIDLIEQSLVNSLPKYLHGYGELGIKPPIWCFLTLTRTKGVGIKVEGFYGERIPIERDILYLPEVVIDDLTTDAVGVLKPLIDMIWNAAGFQRSPHFDAKGKWIG